MSHKTAKKKKIEEIGKKHKATVTEYGGKKVRSGKKSPVREYRSISVDSNDPGYVNRVLIATPTRGQVRMEWALARYGQTIPVNWSQVQYAQFMVTHSPIRFSVANAQNIIVKSVIERDFEWLLLIEDDVILQPDAFMKFNKYIRDEEVPVVSGLYYTKANPPEPLVFRGRGTSFYGKWKLGDKVWVDGVPTGCLLVHAGLLRVLWEESPEYTVNGILTRRVFDDPRKMWYDEATGSFNTIAGTSDLEWCTRIMKDKIFEKAGWVEFQKKKYPFLIDTSIFCRHVDLNSGIQYPS